MIQINTKVPEQAGPSLSSCSSHHDLDDLPRLSLDSDKPGIVRNRKCRIEGSVDCVDDGGVAQNDFKRSPERGDALVNYSDGEDDDRVSLMSMPSETNDVSAMKVELLLSREEQTEEDHGGGGRRSAWELEDRWSPSATASASCLCRITNLGIKQLKLTLTP
ncbi:hypothetical protein L6452_01277 [Arctium lappa]|uniref:Uncharacterized protein n=1 Tax=Arctium lappa TaxID=4217 RepID=A0ACB9FFN8_ARCLA|nr:hypothetical protein L6452_01277 [Arctium lappa]